MMLTPVPSPLSWPKRRFLPRIGDWFNSLPTGNVTNNSVLADRMHLLHIEGWIRSFDVHEVGIHVGTAGAGGTMARLLAYATGADGLPSGAAIDYGEVAVSSTGEKTITIAQTIPPEGLWLGLISNGTPNIWGPQLNMTLAGSGFGKANLTNNQSTSIWHIHTYANPLPDGDTVKDSFLSGGTAIGMAWFKRTA